MIPPLHHGGLRGGLFPSGSVQYLFQGQISYSEHRSYSWNLLQSLSQFGAPDCSDYHTAVASSCSRFFFLMLPSLWFASSITTAFFHCFLTTMSDWFTLSLPVSLYLEVPQDFSLVVLKHLWRWITFWPWDFWHICSCTLCFPVFSAYMHLAPCRYILDCLGGASSHRLHPKSCLVNCIFLFLQKGRREVIELCLSFGELCNTNCDSSYCSSLQRVNWFSG